MSKEMNDLIDAAEERAKLYDDDDRECIKADVMNAFFAGAEYAQAAANKAAEEGGLPPTLNDLARLFADAYENRKEVTLSSESCEKLFLAMTTSPEADRASRQVANKAQHDIWGPNGEFAEFYVAGFEGREICPTTKGNALAAYSNGIKDQVANKAEVEPRIEVTAICGHIPPVCRTPPATTGASTAPVETFIELRSRVAELEKQIREQSVGASTVLTDDRIGQLWHETACAEGLGTREHPAVFARAIEREVAAQAGQVAVPEGFAIVPSNVTREMQKAYFDVIDTNLHKVQTSPHFGRHENMKQAYQAMLAVAPSPAKESK